MSDPENITAMERDLGRQLAALRRQARLTQHELSALTSYSRSTISLAETGQPQTREFWEACDKALESGGVLAAGADQIDTVRGAVHGAAALAAQERRQARALATLAAARRQADVRAAVTAIQECPHCGSEITVLTTLIPSTTPTKAPLSQPR